MNLAKSKACTESFTNKFNGELSIRACTSRDIKEMVSIYEKVFPTYPFPIHDPAYIQKTMYENVDYYCAERKGVILALSSTEFDMTSKSAEMTDFATLQENRSNGCANRLLAVMEKRSFLKGIKTSCFLFGSKYTAK